MLPRSILVKRGYVSSGLPMRYARAVKRGPQIEVPSAQGDELPLRSLMATAAACLALGLALAYGLADREAPLAAATEPTELAPSAAAGAEEASPGLMAEPAPLPEPPPSPTAAVAIVAPDAGAAIEPVPAIGAADAAIASQAGTSEPPPASAPEPVPAVDEPAAPSVEADAANAPQEVEAQAQPAGSSRRLQIKPGVFAYLRCEGVPQRRGKYPCPRDRTLEGRMRTIVEALPTCREAQAIPRGRSFEVRLELGAGGAFKELQVKGPNEAAERAVRACAGPGLRKERTELRTTRMIVSMRFKAH
jgi:hypothetical protein